MKDGDFTIRVEAVPTGAPLNCDVFVGEEPIGYISSLKFSVNIESTKPNIEITLADGLTEGDFQSQPDGFKAAIVHYTGLLRKIEGLILNSPANYLFDIVEK